MSRESEDLFCPHCRKKLEGVSYILTEHGFHGEDELKRKQLDYNIDSFYPEVNWYCPECRENIDKFLMENGVEDNWS